MVEIYIPSLWFCIGSASRNCNRLLVGAPHHDIRCLTFSCENINTLQSVLERYFAELDYFAELVFVY